MGIDKLVKFLQKLSMFYAALYVTIIILRVFNFSPFKDIPSAAMLCAGFISILIALGALLGSLFIKKMPEDDSKSANIIYILFNAAGLVMIVLATFSLVVV